MKKPQVSVVAVKKIEDEIAGSILSLFIINGIKKPRSPAIIRLHIIATSIILLK